LSSKLSFPFEKTLPSSDFTDRIYEEFKTEFGLLPSVPVLARFKKPDGSWTKRLVMIFDTGATISLLPKSIGVQLSVQRYVSHRLIGIAKRKECEIPVKIARAVMKIEDAYGNTSPELQVWVAIAERDDVPTVLGMKGIMDNFRFEADPSEEKLYLTWKK